MLQIATVLILRNSTGDFPPRMTTTICYRFDPGGAHSLALQSYSPICQQCIRRSMVCRKDMDQKFAVRCHVKLRTDKIGANDPSLEHDLRSAGSPRLRIESDFHHGFVRANEEKELSVAAPNGLGGKTFRDLYAPARTGKW